MSRSRQTSRQSQESKTLHSRRREFHSVQNCWSIILRKIGQMPIIAGRQCFVQRKSTASLQVIAGFCWLVTKIRLGKRSWQLSLHPLLCQNSSPSSYGWEDWWGEGLVPSCLHKGRWVGNSRIKKEGRKVERGRKTEKKIIRMIPSGNILLAFLELIVKNN